MGVDTVGVRRLLKRGLRAACSGAHRAVSQDSRLKRCVSVAASAPTSLPDSTAVGTRVCVCERIKARVFVETQHLCGLVLLTCHHTGLEALFHIPGVRGRLMKTNVLV